MKPTAPTTPALPAIISAIAMIFFTAANVGLVTKSFSWGSITLTGMVFIFCLVLANMIDRGSR